MDKVQQLFIRACRSKDPCKRLFSVYRRFYLMTVEDPKPYISAALLQIIEKYNLMTVRELVIELNPDKFPGLVAKEDTTYENLLFSVLISKIRLTHIGKFPGLIKPRIFRES